MQVLAWISHAKRPLLVDELIHALSIEPGATELDRTGFEEADTFIDVCISLVSLDDESRVIRLMHYTLQDYLILNRKSPFPDAEIMITRACLAYLSLDAFEYVLDDDGSTDVDDDDPKDFNDVFKDLVKIYKFLSYAAWAWIDHARVNAETKLEKDILLYLEKDQSTVIPYLVPSRYRYEGARDFYDIYQVNHLPPRTEILRLPMLHKAAAWGFETVVGVLLSQGSDISSEDSNGWTALHWAVCRGHEAVSMLLIDREADINKISYADPGSTPLHLAVEGGNEAVTRLLLKAGARFDIPTSDLWGTTQGFVTTTGNVELVRLFLDAGADVNADTKGRNHRCMLSIAAAVVNEQLVKLLLDRGANVNGHVNVRRENLFAEATMQGRERTLGNFERRIAGASPLLIAVDRFEPRHNNVKIIKLLLEHGAEPNTPRTLSEESVLQVVIRKYAETPKGVHGLQVSVHFWSRAEQTIQLLLEKGANPNMGDAKGKAPLWWAVCHNCANVTGLLLDNGTDPNLDPVKGFRPLSIAALNGNEIQVRLLLGAGADPNFVEDVALTPLSVAALQHHKSIERLLLEKGARANLSHIFGSLALAIITSNFIRVESLLRNGVDPDMRYCGGRTPLMLAVSWDRSAIVRETLQSRR